MSPASTGVGRTSRAFWSLVDQALSSAQNFGLALVVLRASTVAEFGAFSLGFGLYLVLLNVVRAAAADPLTLRSSHVPDEDWVVATRRASGAALALGFVLALPLLAVGAVGSGRLRITFLVLGLALPGLVQQDTWRFAFFARGRPSAAAANDALWLLLQAVLTMALLATRTATPGRLLLAWGGSAAVAALAGSVQAGLRPQVGQAAGWLRENRDVSLPLAGQYTCAVGAIQAALAVLAAVAGLAQAGLMRAAQVLAGPLYLVFQAVLAYAVPEAVRLQGGSAAAARSFAWRIGAGLAALGLLGGVALLLVPGSLGRTLLPSAWDGCRPLFLPLLVFLTADGWAIGPQVGLRALGEVGHGLRLGLVTLPLIPLAAGLGAAADGALGAAWALAAVNVGAAVWWSVRLLRTFQAPQLSRPAAPPTVGPQPGGGTAAG